MTDIFALSMKKQKKQILQENPIEAMRDVASDTVTMAKEDLVVGTAKKMTEQLFGGSIGVSSNIIEGNIVESGKMITGNISQGEALSVEDVKKREFGQRRVEEFKNGEKRLSIYEEEKITSQIEEILVELKKIAKETKELEMEFKEVIMESVPENAGKYHVSFFTFVLKLLKVARKKINESATWMSCFSSRKRQKGYWAMYKKGGTKFALSGERAVATSTG